MTPAKQENTAESDSFYRHNSSVTWVLSSIFRKFVSDKMKSRAGTRRWSGYAPINCLKAYAGGEVKSGEAVHLDS